MNSNVKLIKSKVSKTKKLNKLLGGTLVHNLPNFIKGSSYNQGDLKSFSELGVCTKIPKNGRATFRKFYAVKFNDDVYLYYFKEDKNEYMGRLKVLERDWFENGLQNNVTIINDLKVNDDKDNKTTISLKFKNNKAKKEFNENYQKFLESVEKEKNRSQNNKRRNNIFFNNITGVIKLSLISMTPQI